MWCLRISFFGEGERRAGGVRLQGADQVVVNNLFHSLNAFGVGMMDGDDGMISMCGWSAL